MTVLGGLQSAVAAVKAKKAAGFNTDDGIRRATIGRPVQGILRADAFQYR